MITFLQHISDPRLRETARKVLDGERITPEEGIILYTEAGLPLLSVLARAVRERLNGNLVFFNRNFHIEPTNICINNCLFCSYRKSAGDPESWQYSVNEIMEIVRRFDNVPVTEVHITGGVHPKRDISFYCELLRAIKAHRPGLHIKAFSAIELDFMFRHSGLTAEKGLEFLKDCGLESIPGGGAEIFDTGIRNRICPGKTSAERWLEIHEKGHLLGLPSNATMLYGHVEDYSHRIAHMELLRQLQDKTGGFNAFIPLKFKRYNNPMSEIPEVSTLEDMRNYAVSRIFLDNFRHIKAYWPMLGREQTRMSLSFGADDVDGTIEDTTRIYSMAGADEKNPVMNSEELTSLIRREGYTPAERDSLYNIIREY